MCRDIIEHRGICKKCKQLNKEKREETICLDGYVALVTGARVKIGYATALRLLRAGATVIAVTRFPYDALNNYTKEKDFNTFKDRLFIYELDLRFINQIESLIEYVEKTFGKLDILINNAAQTNKKNRQYYIELEKNEEELKLVYNINNSNKMIKTSKELENKTVQFPLVKDNSQILGYEENPMYNSWVAKHQDISIEELLEVQLINVLAPFLLVSHFKDLMKKSDKLNKFIINVSSVEGKFYKKRKLSRHVHTNMAKASLNMLTHSLNMEYEKERIYMYSVDPGWVSNQFPEGYKISKEFEPYLSFEDGAARICAPIYYNLNKQKVTDSGVYYKDFKIEEY